MFQGATKALSALAIGATLTACAVVPREQAAADVNEMVEARGRPPVAWPAASGEAAADEKTRVAELLAEPLSLERAVHLSFLRNARIREAYAELGIAQADVIEASRLPNPSFGYVDLSPREADEGSQITRSVTLGFADLLLLPARARFARGEYERLEWTLADSLLELAAEVETAWYEYVSAKQVAAMRLAVTKAADSSAEFAERSFDAGNIEPRDLALERAAASEARIEAARAAAEATRARTRLAESLGVSAREEWDTPDVLPAPASLELSYTAVVDQALEGRLDLAAARRQVALLEDALGVTRRWRFLSDFEVGYESESESDGARLRGPSVSLGLPLFNWGNGRVLRASAELESARARLAAIELRVRNEISLALDRLSAARDIAERYRTALVPQREEVVKRELERYNFMIGGVFELLLAKRAEYEAYEEYLESVRDYWLACTELKRAIGGQHACEANAAGPTIGVDAVLEPGKQDSADHSQMDHSQMDHSRTDEKPPTPPKKDGDRP